MKEKIEQIKNMATEEINSVEELKDLNDVRVKYLGKKGELTLILREMGKLSKEERPVIGSIVNETRDLLENLISNKEAELNNKELEERLKTETIDVTEPSKKINLGSMHPITRINKEIEDIFIGL